MKKLLLMSMILLGTIVGFTSCSDDDDDSGVKDGDKELVVSAKNEQMTVQMIAYFKDDVCTGGKVVLTCNMEEIAQAVFYLLKETGAPATIQGSAITIDLSDQLKGLKRAEVQKFFEDSIKEYEKQFTV